MSFSTRVQDIATYFKNVTLNAFGVERSLYELLNDKDISRAISLMENNDTDVDNALAEYNPQLHSVMSRPNKPRKNERPYITCKLARSRQRTINEVELFFLLNNPIRWKKEDGDDEAYNLFMDFLSHSRFNSAMRKVKRLAGAETESAKLYHIYRDRDNNAQCDVVVLARSTGYKLRPLFDQYGKLLAFAYGYTLKEGVNSVEHWDIHTTDFIFECKKANVGWQVNSYPNPTGKINVIYYKQDKAWAGVEPRIEREEELDSKIGDTNNYFADPIAIATADVVDFLGDNSKPGKLIQVTGSNSDFKYVNPPQASAQQDAERKSLRESILFDTFTPDFDFDKLRGALGTSGAAIKNSMVLGFIKRNKNIELYGELVDRERSVIISVLKYLHPEMASKLDELKLSFEFAEPFASDNTTEWNNIRNLYSAGLISLETAVERLSLTNAPQEEIDRIRMASTEKMMAEAELQEERGQETAEQSSPESEEGEPVEQKDEQPEKQEESV